MGANTPSPASTPGWVWDLSVSIAQLTLRAHELGAAAEFLGAANKAFVARAQERPKPTEDELRLAADVERDLRRHLGGLDREQTEEVKNAADQVVNLLSRMLRTHDPVVALARNPDGFLDYVYTHGGKQLRGQFGGRAKAVFTDLLKVAVDTCARYAPGRQDLTPYVTAEILRISDRTEGAAARISSQLDDIQETQSGEPVGGTLARYRHRIEPLYPADFRDRDSDRARAARIARGEHGPWWWWTGGPWTGKTALMASLLIDPPATEVATAAFFVLGREAGANSRRSFYTQVIPQLAELAGRSRISIPGPEDVARTQTLFEQVLAEAAAQQPRLLLVLDGLDEDAALFATNDVRHHTGGSIAAALPAELPSNVTVVVASRPSPELADDVPDHHPLRRSDIRHDLGQVEAAIALRTKAESDLKGVLKDSDFQDVPMFIIAADSALTARDLSAFLNSRPGSRRLAPGSVRDFLSSRHESRCFLRVSSDPDPRVVAA